MSPPPMAAGNAEAGAQQWAVAKGQLRWLDDQVRDDDDGKSAQKLGHLQPSMAVFSQECMGQRAYFGPT